MILLFFYLISNVLSLTIKLNSTNNLVLNSVIDKDSTTKFLYDLNLKSNKKNIYLYLNTPGGSVDYGMKIVNAVQKYKINCIAETAYSMGFIILQACNKRYITGHSSLMQHQMSFGIHNEKGKIENYMSYINSMEQEIVDLQISRLNLSSELFKGKILNEWWLYGKSAIRENCADKIIDVICSIELTKQNYTNTEYNYIYTYSKCPLIPNYIDKVKKNDSSDNSFIYFI